MYETSYHLASDVKDAAARFAAAGEARYLAGGQTLIPTMKQRLAAPSQLIDISRLAELRGIAASGDVVTIGAATTHAEVQQSDAVSHAIPALALLAGLIGDPAVRHRGTLGGSLANNDPAADYPAAALALGATIHTDKRAIPADDFFTGLFTTALDDGEIITKVAFPVPAKAAYQKFKHPASGYAMTGVFLARSKPGEVRVAVTGAGNRGVFRAVEIEKVLGDHFFPAAIDAVAIDPGTMLSDIHGSAAYRANLVKVLTKRAVKAAG
jgi:aerobic carbon-monoxide dehydrogenase medium subunit